MSAPAASRLPEVGPTHDGRVGIYVGGAYRLLPPDEARAFAQRVLATADEVEQRIGAAR